MTLLCSYQDHKAVLQLLQALSRRKMQQLEKEELALKGKSQSGRATTNAEGKAIVKGKSIAKSKGQVTGSGSSTVMKVWHREHLKAYLNTSVLSELKMKTSEEDLREACVGEHDDCQAFALCSFGWLHLAVSSILDPSPALEARYPWLSLLSSREADLLRLCQLSSAFSGGIIDLSQSLGRSHLRQCCPCVTPSGRLFSLDRHRLLLGVEKLALQGLVFYDCPDGVLMYSDDFLPSALFSV